MMTEAYANITFTMRYYQSEDGTRKGSHIPFNFLMITELNKASTANDFVSTINKWLNYMPSSATANWVVSLNFRISSRLCGELEIELLSYNNLRKVELENCQMLSSTFHLIL